MRLVVSVSIVLAGCGVTSSGPFAVEPPNCSVVNTVQTSGSMTSWNDCRVFWSGGSSDVLTVELTVPGTTGSFADPDFKWVRASVHAPGGSTTGVHHVTAFPSATALPMAVPDDMVMLEMPIASCGDLGGSQPQLSGLEFQVMADVGNASASFSFAFPGAGADCYYSGGSTHLTGGFVITANGAAASNDPAAVVTVP